MRKKHTAVRLPEDLIHKVDQEAQRLQQETGLDINRCDIVRLALRKYFHLVPDPDKTQEDFET